MFGWGKKKDKDVEQEVIADYIKQIQKSFIEMNNRLIKEFTSIDIIQKSVKANQSNIMTLSQHSTDQAKCLNFLIQGIQALTARVEQLEGHLSLSSVKFEKDKSN